MVVLVGTEGELIVEGVAFATGFRVVFMVGFPIGFPIVFIVGFPIGFPIVFMVGFPIEFMVGFPIEFMVGFPIVFMVVFPTALPTPVDCIGVAGECAGVEAITVGDIEFPVPTSAETPALVARCDSDTTGVISAGVSRRLSFAPCE